MTAASPKRTTVFGLIIGRIRSKLRRSLLTWVIVPVVAFVVLNLILLLIVYVECWVFGEATYSWTTLGEVKHTIVCRPTKIERRSP